MTGPVKSLKSFNSAGEQLAKYNALAAAYALGTGTAPAATFKARRPPPPRCSPELAARLRTLLDDDPHADRVPEPWEIELQQLLP